MTLVRLCIFAASVAAILIVSPVVQAETITLDAVQDTTLIEAPSTERDTPHDDSKIVISSINKTTDRAMALFQFDLSGLPGEITAAHIELYDLGTSGYTTAFVTRHYILTPSAGATDEELVVLNAGNDVAFDKDGMHEEYCTYNTYTGATGGGHWSESSSYIAQSIAADNSVGYYSSPDFNTNQTMLDLLNENRTGKGYVIILGYRNASKRIFDDREGDYAPRLVVDAVPEPGTFVLLAGLGCLAALLRGRKE